MPELPEVETVRRILAPQLVGQRILTVNVRNPQIVAHPGAQLFAERLRGQTVRELCRRGKFLTIRFADGDRMTLHLRMTGQLLVTPADAPLAAHTHLLAALSGGAQLRYCDVRRFGRFWYLRADEDDRVCGLDKLGPEPLDEALTAEYLHAKLGTRRRAVKEALLDQSLVAGIGNIYADEILCAAALHPETPCSALSDADWSRLAEQIKAIIVWAIRANEMSPEEYLAGKGRDYRSIVGLRAYGREGQPCLRCGAAMKRIVVGGRSSTYCPACQRMEAQPQK